MTPKLTITLGVRFENLDNPDDPILNPIDRNANGSYNLTGRDPGRGQDQISPRLGISWSPGDQKTVVRFSAGRFWSRTPAILLAQLFTSNGLRGTQYQINAPTDPGTRRSCSRPIRCRRAGARTSRSRASSASTSPQVPNPTRAGRLRDRPGLREPLHRPPHARLRARGGLRRRSAGLDLTYAEGQAAPAPDRHQPAVRRHARRRTACRATAGRARTPTTAASRPASRTPSRSTPAVTVAPPAPPARQLPVLRGDDLVAGRGQRLERAQLRRHPGRGRQQPRPATGAPRPRPGVARSSSSGLWQTPLVGDRAVAARSATRPASPWTITAGSDVNGDTNNVDRPTINGIHVERNSERQPDTYSLDLRIGKDFTVGARRHRIFAECFNCTDEANRFVPSNNMVWGNANLLHADPAPTSARRPANRAPPRTFQFGVRFDLTDPGGGRTA